MLQGAAAVRATCVPGAPVLRQTPTVEVVLDGQNKTKKTSKENDMQKKIQKEIQGVSM